jgi:hypothetical protein
MSGSGCVSVVKKSRSYHMNKWKFSLDKELSFERLKRLRTEVPLKTKKARLEAGLMEMIQGITGRVRRIAMPRIRVHAILLSRKCFSKFSKP